MKQLTANPAAFYLSGDDTGILMIHGFTGSASEYSLIGPYLNNKGLTVSVPLLPGHGTTPQDLNQQHWQDWVNHAERALAELQSTCETVFIAGLSMGSLITLELASRHPELAGVITYSPPIGVKDWRANLVRLLKYVTSTIAKPDDVFADPEADKRLFRYSVYPAAAVDELLKLMRQTQGKLGQVTTPILVIEVADDASVKDGSGQAVIDGVATNDKKLVTLHNSGHVLTLDADWQVAAEATLAFINDHVRVVA